MSDLNVLMVNKYYPPHLGGVESHVRDLAEGLSGHAGVSVTVLVVNDGPGHMTEYHDKLRVVRVPRAFEYASTPVSWRFASTLRDLAADADIVHTHFPYPYGEACLLADRLPKPLVVTYHTDIVRQKRMLAAYRPLLNAFLDRADRIIATSPNMVEHSPYLNVRADKVRVVDFGLPLDHIQETPALVARAAQLRAPFADRPLLLFVGRLVYYKGANVLVEAFAKAHTDAELVIVGDGPLKEELVAQTTRLGVADRVTIVPPQSTDDLAAWYHAADVLVLPSTERSEAFGLVQIEAHAAGTPVISTDLTTGVPYANLDGVTGDTVPVGDASALAVALDTLLDDEQRRKRYGEAARARAFTQFSVPRMVSNTLDVYDEAQQHYYCRAAHGPRQRRSDGWRPQESDFKEPGAHA